jgi:hypothetical protein
MAAFSVFLPFYLISCFVRFGRIAEVTIKGAKGPQSAQTGPTADSPKRALVTISASE